MTSRRSRFLRKLNHTKRLLDTRALREKALQQLEQLFTMALDQTRQAKSAKDQQTWARIAGYLGQVINSLSSTYHMQTKGDLDREDLATLLSRIAQEVEKDEKEPQA